ncbi:hypothetical protein [Nocardiopsis sp. HUAS JQ3]|uniref:hypothetical protein n=1 Tax=Nocardiopsis sp. HUAS JQ3 TaxID=3061629 RepID=UPI0023A9687D|nr:hypothetical protein [Nocardiopsis sp. HUAS JQ3]WDZ90278.1 hypothetical protein PV789_25845 [Nocardiopsis sp. HUAS JQ3]
MPPLPRVPVGDLLAAPSSATPTAPATAAACRTASSPPGEFDELRDLVRVWCALSD